MSKTLTIAIFDDNHQEQKSMKERFATMTSSKDGFLGKVVVPVSCMVQNQMYHQDLPMFIRKNGKVKEAGSVQISMALKTTQNLVMGYSLPILMSYKVRCAHNCSGVCAAGHASDEIAAY